MKPWWGSLLNNQDDSSKVRPVYILYVGGSCHFDSPRSWALNRKKNKTLDFTLKLKPLKHQLWLENIPPKLELADVAASPHLRSIYPAGPQDSSGIHEGLFWGFPTKNVLEAYWWWLESCLGGRSKPHPTCRRVEVIGVEEFEFEALKEIIHNCWVIWMRRGCNPKITNIMGFSLLIIMLDKKCLN